MRKIAAVLALLLANFFVHITAPPAQAAYSCTTVWLSEPSYFSNFDSGTKRCLWLKDTSSTGWIKVYRRDDRNLKIVDWVSPYGFTKIAPNGGRYKPNADMVRALADKYNLHIQFANRNLSGQLACTGIWAGQINGNYHASPREPGKGLIRLGTGLTSTCMRDRAEVWNTAVHESAHALMERKCPKIFSERRHEHVADAYAWKFLKATNRHPGNYGFTSRDLTRAKQVANRNC